jgi:hypothetical protein
VNIAMNYPLDVGLMYETALQQPYLQAVRQGASAMLEKVKEKK